MKDIIRYEDNAEQRTLTGWVCKTCGRFWGDDEHMARYCHATDFPCECGKRYGRFGSACDSCSREKRRNRDLSKWEKMPVGKWDGKQMIYSISADKYFSDPEEVEDYLTEDSWNNVEDLLLVLCRPTPAPHFNCSEFLCDVLPEDGDIDAEEIDKTVNDWIAAQMPISWKPGKERLVSLKE